MRSDLAALLGLDPGGLGSLLVGQPVALGLGFISSWGFIWWRSRGDGLSGRQTAELLIAAYLGALVVGRGLDMLMWGEAFWRQPWRVLDPWFGSASTLGGLIGALLGVVYGARRLGLDAIRFLDRSAPAAGLAVAFFKSGCLLAGCCFGARTESWLGLRFPPSSLVYYHQLGTGLIDAHYHHSLPVHPVQAYEAGWGLLSFAVLLLLGRGLLRWPGAATSLGAALLLAGRFAVEGFRETAQPGLLRLTLGQWVCMIGVLALLTLWLRPGWRASLRAQLTPAAESPPDPGGR